MKKFKGTTGEWSLPHFAINEKDSCQCGFVLSDHHCGAIATVHFSVDDKNGDNPLIDEAKYNALLISKAPEILNTLIKLVDVFKKEYGPETIGQAYIWKAEKIIKQATEL